MCAGGALGGPDSAGFSCDCHLHDPPEYEIPEDELDQDGPPPHPFYSPLSWAALPWEVRDRIARERGWRKL